MNKREILLDLIDTGKTQDYIPAAFFLHFDPKYHQGQAAVDKHLDYFHYTGMDFVKIQYERGFPRLPAIQHPEDWGNMPFYGLGFYEPQLKVVEGLVKAIKKDALVLLTLYSPFMCACHTAGDERTTEHIRQNPEQVKKGMDIITDSLLGFVKECIRLGVDGFYHSTQGGESHRFQDSQLFDNCVKPYDLILMNEINQSCIFNILHICDYNDSYDDLSPFIDYPGNIVNCSLNLNSKEISPNEVCRLFSRPFMGGLERKGIIATGSQAQIVTEVESLIHRAPEKYFLAADCTVPSDTPWDNLRTAIETAHQYKRK